MELCEHGILVNRATFSSWYQIGLAGWTLDDDGHLVVGQGLWKMAGQVPPYKRQRVKELLTEKTAEPR
jgi:hypothetical protein